MAGICIDRARSSGRRSRSHLKMAFGKVYLWEPCESEFTGGRVRAEIVQLPYLDPSPGTSGGLSGRFADVVNVGQFYDLDNSGAFVAPRWIGNARPNVDGDFVYEPGIGGGRLDKKEVADSDFLHRYAEASHFGEVNTYYHITRVAERVNRLLEQLGERPLPRVRVLVNAHHAAIELGGKRDGVRNSMSGKWLAFQGGHYRLPTHRDLEMREYGEIASDGEIHLGPGRQLTREGWLPQVAGRPYRCNASHNAGILYHEYGHHITRHTADFQANTLKAPHRQSNRKTATDEALSDYWAASMLGTPHIWCWHRRHDPEHIHPRSLATSVTMEDYDGAPAADPHQNGTILATALWDIRQRSQAGLNFDRLVLAALLSLGRLRSDPYCSKARETRRLREGFAVFAACLLQADTERFNCSFEADIRAAMQLRGICFCEKTLNRLARPAVSASVKSAAEDATICEQMALIRTRCNDAIIPVDEEMLLPDALATQLRDTPPYDLVAVGDVMPGARARRLINKNGPDYSLAWVAPLLRKAPNVMGNLEGPFARIAKRAARNYSYKINPRYARVLRRAGFNVMNLANNHLLDCGHDGVLETLETLDRHGIEAIGAGIDEKAAHKPALLYAGGLKIGFLGYYWNRRTAARDKRPGSARDLPHLVERDIAELKRQVDRVVVTVHWGIPYERQPAAQVRQKARHFIDCGADIVIGHHPHIIQPVEIYRGCAIFYSVGNFLFGSANSRAESLLLGIRFLDGMTEIDVFPVYVRNRDPRLAYQPKIMGGEAAKQTIQRLASISGAYGNLITLDGIRGRLRVSMPDKAMA